MEQRFALVCLHETDTLEDGQVKFIPCMVKRRGRRLLPYAGQPRRTPKPLVFW